MITGHFDLALKNSGTLSDADFENAMTHGCLQGLLDGLDTQLECHTDNLIMDLIVPYTAYFLFGAPTVGDLWRNLGAAVFGGICLLTTDSEPDYQNEWYRNGGYNYTSYSNMPESANTSSAGKRFVEDASEAAQKLSDPGGREAVWYRERWLYLPSQGISSNIRSIAVLWSADADHTGDVHKQRSARVRLKDAGNNPIIINKDANQVLLIEYKVTFVSI